MCCFQSREHYWLYGHGEVYQYGVSGSVIEQWLLVPGTESKSLAVMRVIKKTTRGRMRDRSAFYFTLITL